MVDCSQDVVDGSLGWVLRKAVGDVKESKNHANRSDSIRIQTTEVKSLSDNAWFLWISGNPAGRSGVYDQLYNNAGCPAARGERPQFMRSQTLVDGERSL